MAFHWLRYGAEQGSAGAQLELGQIVVQMLTPHAPNWAALGREDALLGPLPSAALCGPVLSMASGLSLLAQAAARQPHTQAERAIVGRSHFVRGMLLLSGSGGGGGGKGGKGSSGPAVAADEDGGLRLLRAAVALGCEEARAPVEAARQREEVLRSLLQGEEKGAKGATRGKARAAKQAAPKPSLHARVEDAALQLASVARTRPRPRSGGRRRRRRTRGCSSSRRRSRARSSSCAPRSTS